MSFEMKRDVLIHFNEATDEVVIFNVASSETSNIREQEFHAGRFKIDWLKSKDPDEAEKLIGSIVFSTIDAFSDKQINIRDYSTLLKLSMSNLLLN